MILSPASVIMAVGRQAEAELPEQGQKGVTMKDTHRKKKMAAPIVITILFLAYLIAYGIGIGAATEWNPLMILLALPLAALGVGMVYTLRTRIKEIRSGEEDDLGNY